MEQNLDLRRKPPKNKHEKTNTRNLPRMGWLPRPIPQSKCYGTAPKTKSKENTKPPKTTRSEDLTRL